MARRCFEVSSLTFKLSYHENNALENSKRAEELLEKVQKYLKTYASNTTIRDNFMIVDNMGIVMDIEFQKRMSANTVNNILRNVLEEKVTYSTIYTEIDRKMTVIN